MKNSIIRWVLTALTLLIASPVHAEGLKPFVKHDLARSPAGTVHALKEGGTYDAFVRELARNSRGLTETEVDHRLQNAQWSPAPPCTGCNYLFAGLANKYIGYIARSLEAGEQLWCIDSTACFSTYCGNPTKVTTPLPEIPSPPPETKPVSVYQDCDSESVTYRVTGSWTPRRWSFTTPFVPWQNNVQIQTGGTTLYSNASSHRGECEIIYEEEGATK